MPLAQRILSTTTLGLLLCTLAVVGMQPVQAAKPPPTPLSCSISPADGSTGEGVAITFTGSTLGGKGGKTYDWDFSGGSGSPSSSTANPVNVTYAAAGTYEVLLDVEDTKGGAASCRTTVTVDPAGAPQCSDSIDNDGDTLIDFPNDPGCADATDDDETDAQVAQCDDGIDNDGDGLIDFPVDPGCDDANDVDETDTPECSDGIDNDGDTLIDFPNDPGCARANDNIELNLPPIDPNFAPQTDFKIMMNYELGMHCTGFEFAYCCVLPVYNSILAQVVKPNQSAPQHGGDFPMLLEGDPNEGLDPLGRETVVRDKGELDTNGNFKKYVLKYWHEAQPRNDGRGKPQQDLLISAVEGNSLMAWNTSFDSVALNPDGSFVTGSYNGSDGVMKGNNTLGEGADNYQNAVWNHLYYYDNLEGDNTTGTSLEKDKTRLGVNGHVVYPPDCGAALHPMGPTTQGGDPNNAPVANDCNGLSNGNVLTFSGHKGTVVYTQMKVLENLPIMLTSPDIWEALGLPLTPFEDSIDFFSDPGLLNEDSVRPFVAMKAQMYVYDGANNDTAVTDQFGDPVVGFGTAPIDIPNCERCHSNGPDGTQILNAPDESPDPDNPNTLTVANSPNPDKSLEWTRTQEEYAFWNAYYNIDKGAGDSDWYSRLKSAALSMLTAHDTQHGTSFTANYPGTEVAGEAPQNTRLGHESVICQRCHADNVIAVVKSANCGAGNADPTMATEPCAVDTLIMPITEAIHNNHRGINMADASGVGGDIVFADDQGRDGGCQGCHPAHRSNGDMQGYPITLAGTNYYNFPGGDNRGASGGCFVGRDVHSNPGKDTDGVETPAHLNAVGQYLADNVANDGNGIWCTNCHNQLGQEMWKTENMDSLVHGVGTTNPRGEPTLAAVAAAVGTDEAQAISWLDPKEGANPGDDDSYAIWAEDPGLCDYVGGYVGGAIDPAHDGAVATVEVSMGGGTCSNEGSGTDFQVYIDCGFAAFDLCGSVDGDGDFSVNLPGATTPGGPFCTTPDCVAAAQGTLDSPCNLEAGDRCAVPVPMSAATDGRDHWLAPGEPHCADCHEAPFVEQSGNINAYPPFNYPRKASLMRYSRGHQDISCQGCHESIHGLYPVTPNIDTTSYAQAAALNHDGSHGPLKCGTCHEVDRNGIPTWMSGVKYNGSRIRSYDDAVAWMHTFTDEVSPLEPEGVCENCHGDRSSKMGEDKGKWLRHSFVGRIGRDMQDKAEIAAFGHVAGDPDPDGIPDNGDERSADDIADLVCSSCHSLQGGPSGAFLDVVYDELTGECSKIWKSHNIDGRVSEKVWEFISVSQSGGTCGW